MKYKLYSALLTSLCISQAYSMSYLTSYQLPFNGLPDIHKLFIGLCTSEVLHVTRTSLFPLANEYLNAPTKDHLARIYETKKLEEKDYLSKNYNVKDSSQFIIMVNKYRRILMTRCLLTYGLFGVYLWYLKSNY